MRKKESACGLSIRLAHTLKKLLKTVQTISHGHREHAVKSRFIFGHQQSEVQQIPCCFSIPCRRSLCCIRSMLYNVMRNPPDNSLNHLQSSLDIYIFVCFMSCSAAKTQSVWDIQFPNCNRAVHQYPNKYSPDGLL